MMILLKLASYIMGVEMMLNQWVSFASFALVLAGMLMAVTATRKTEGGFISFGRAFLVAFSAAAISTLLVLLLDLVLGTLVDPQLNEKILRVTKQSWEDSGMLSLIPKAELEGVLAQLKWTLQPMGQSVSWLLGLVFWSIVALIVGAIMKRIDPQQF